MAGDTIPSISMRALFTTEESSTSMGIKLVFNMTISEGEFHEFDTTIIIFVFLHKRLSSKLHLCQFFLGL